MDYRSRSRRAGHANRGTARPQRRVEPSGAEDRMAQAPRIGMRGVRDPGADAGVDVFLRISGQTR